MTGFFIFAGSIASVAVASFVIAGFFAGVECKLSQV
jgi:hypothetical protein